jgi:hypothetical protein
MKVLVNSCRRVLCQDGDGVAVLLEEDLEGKFLPLEFADHGGAFADADQMVHLLSLFPRQEIWYD